MKRRIFALLLVAVVLTAVFVGCARSDEKEPPKTDDKQNGSATGGDEVVDLKWIMVGNGMPPTMKHGSRTLMNT